MRPRRWFAALTQVKRFFPTRGRTTHIVSRVAPACRCTLKAKCEVNRIRHAEFAMLVAEIVQHEVHFACPCRRLLVAQIRDQSFKTHTQAARKRSGPISPRS